jgi:glycine betaine catabolism B
VWQFETAVAEIIPRTPAIRSFRFPVRAKGVRYLAGQFFFCTIKIDEEEAIHHFSFSSSPTEKGYIEFTKRITASDFSQQLARMKVGDWARLQGPDGHFTLPRQPRKLAFLSGGIGITPLRSMLRYITDKGLPYDVVLLYGNGSLGDAAFRDELGSITSGHHNIRVEHVLAGPDFPPGWQGHRGYINTDVIREAVPDYRERLFYISGPPRMVTTLQEQLSALGVPEAQARRDSFTGYD